ncbi:MAG: DUF4411 family protein [Xanthomonadaceae bacterium]|nr:DUF4411 family protein [Xanthomonadaceae bacterium]
MIYLLDASVLITANNLYYPIDRVPEYWGWLEYLGESGKVKIPQEIFEEIRDGPDDAEKDLLYGWLQDESVRNALLLAEDVDVHAVRHVVERGYASDLTDTEVEMIGRDPFLIAYAIVDVPGRWVVTCEVSKRKLQRQNRRVPDVCDDLGVKWCDPFRMNRDLGFKTSWKQK